MSYGANILQSWPYVKQTSKIPYQYLKGYNSYSDNAQVILHKRHPLHMIPINNCNTKFTQMKRIVTYVYVCCMYYVYACICILHAYSFINAILGSRENITFIMFRSKRRVHNYCVTYIVPSDISGIHNCDIKLN